MPFQEAAGAPLGKVSPVMDDFLGNDTAGGGLVGVGIGVLVTAGVGVGEGSLVGIVVGGATGVDVADATSVVDSEGVEAVSPPAVAVTVVTAEVVFWGKLQDDRMTALRRTMARIKKVLFLKVHLHSEKDRLYNR